jgi:diguanylate cyclase (GGDEF)-like protein
VAEWALRRRRLANGESIVLGPIAELGDHELELADAAELPVLRALLRISQAVMRATFFDEALEVIAEQTLLALGAASVSISRWEPQVDAVRTLINVGALGPDEERWPDNELYSAAGDQPVSRLLHTGLPYVIAIDDDEVDAIEAMWLRHIGKDCELAVPVMYRDVMWGELWVTGVGNRRFGSDDVQLLQAIAAYVAVAIGRSELLSTVWQYAYQDPLTGLANRRELERRFDEMDWETVSPAVLVCDLDRFKQINDQQGHPAGDVLLKRVATVLGDLTAPIEGAMAVRLGGDEFCIVLPHSDLVDAERFAIEASAAVRRWVGTTVTLSWGGTASGTQKCSGQALMEAADAALLEAKTLGPGCFSVGVVGSTLPGGSSNRRRAEPHSGRRAVDLLLRRVVDSLDRHRPPDIPAALDILALHVHDVIDAAGWSISVTTDDGSGVRTIAGVDSSRDPVSGLSVLRRIDARTVYRLADYPSTAHSIASGEAFVAAVDLDTSDPAEVRLLQELEYRAVLVVGVSSAACSYVLEIFSRTGHQELTAIAPYVRVLAHYCITKCDGQLQHEVVVDRHAAEGEVSSRAHHTTAATPIPG